MPIVGMTDDKARHYGDGTPLLGRIYKGDEKETKKRKDGTEYQIFGKDLDHFRVEFEPQFEFLRDEWIKMYCPNGESGPKEFGWVELCGDDIETAFPSYMEEWKANQKLIHRCTGDEQVKWWSDEARDHLTGHKACEMKAAKPCGCQLTGRLDIILLEFNNFTGVHGHFLVTTHSFHDIVSIHGFLKHLKRRGLPSFENIPFTFGREMRPIAVPIEKNGIKTGERAVVEKSLLYLYLEPEFFKAVFVPEWKARRDALLAGLVPALTDGVTVAEAKKMLGSGGSHRIGATTKPTTPTEPPDNIIVMKDDDDVVDGEASDAKPTTDGPIVMYKPGFDWQQVYVAIADLFNADQHRDNAIRKLEADGKLNPTLSEKGVIEIIKANRAEREQEKQQKKAAGE